MPKVLEVGCGHGLLLFHPAPDVKEYVATDLSGTIIERNRERARREGLSHVKLRQAAASEIRGIGESDFDVIVMSSVVHYFPNTFVPLEEVIRSAIGLLKEEESSIWMICWITGKRGNWQSRRRPTKRPTRVFGQNKLG
ncbi:class I SAM-dependent methyltransferase [Paenibacillus larvae]|nr:class I SAM-dependent methyltransferase [Paenibacillus larvae]